MTKGRAIRVSESRRAFVRAAIEEGQARKRQQAKAEPCSWWAVPGGLSREQHEAEARRRVRFFPIGHTPGEAPEPRRMENPEHPLTLDLRRA